MRLFPRQLFILDPNLVEGATIEEVAATFADMEELGLVNPPYPEFDLLTKGEYVFGNKNKDEEIRDWINNDVSHWLVMFRFRDGKMTDMLLDRSQSKIKYSNLEMTKDSDGRDMLRVPKGTPINELPGFLREIMGEPAPPLHFDPRTTKFFSILKELAPERLATKGWSSTKDAQFLSDCHEAGRTWYRLLIVLLATKNITKAMRTDKLAKAGIARDKRHVYTTTLSLGRVAEIGSEPMLPGIAKRPHLRRGHLRSQHYGPRNQFLKRVWIEPCFVNADEDFVNERTAYNVSKRRPAS